MQGRFADSTKPKRWLALPTFKDAHEEWVSLVKPTVYKEGTPSRSLSGLLDEAERWGAGLVVVKRTDVRQNGFQILFVVDSEPHCHFSGKFIDRGCWNQSASTKVQVSVGRVKWIQQGGGILTKHRSAIDSSAHDQMVASPSVIGTLSIGSERPREVGRREGNHIIFALQLLHCVGKGTQCAADLWEIILLCIQQVRMIIPPTD